MKAEVAVLFLKALGGKNPKKNGKWVTCGCPLGPYLHKDGHDANPSFGVRINDQGESRFNCFACESGSLEKLVSTLEYHWLKNPVGHMDFKTARALLDEEGSQVWPLPDYESEDQNQMFEEWPAWLLNLLPPAYKHPAAADYLAARGCPGELSDRFDLRWDEQKTMIACPYRNVYGRFAGIRGRNINPNAPKHFRHFDYTYGEVNNASLVWYNEQVLEMPGPLIIVEGQFDCMHVAQVYPKVIANLTAKPSQQKLKKLGGIDQILFMMDNDATGAVATDKYLEHFQGSDTQVGVIEYPVEWKDPDAVPLQWLQNTLEEAGIL